MNCELSISHAHLHIHAAVVVLGKGAVVGEDILRLDLKIFAEAEVETYLIVGFGVQPSGAGTVKVVAAFHHEFVAINGNDGKGIEAVGLIGSNLVAVAVGVGLNSEVGSVARLLVGGGKAQTSGYTRRVVGGRPSYILHSKHSGAC